MSTTSRSITLTAPDISCAHCVATIEKALNGLDGVESVTADAQTKQIDVRYDAGRVTLDRIESVLDEEGYPVQA
jgi:copper chaperone